MVKLRS